MPEKEDSISPQSGTGALNNSFSKGMLKDYNETFIGEGLYTHARNAVNNSHDGQVGVIGNEPSNIKCVDLPYTLIGCIGLVDDQWVVFTTDDINSEIGIFDESACSYTKVVNSACLNFKKSHLITGAYRKRYDCERMIYWDDGLNPTRTMDLDDIPYKYKSKIVNGCEERTYTDEIDCEAIRMASLMKHPCIKISRGNIAGTMPNGSYQACIAYTINQVRVSDYIGLSAVQPLWTHQNVISSLQIDITDIDTRFDEFELVLVTNVNAQTVCKSIGYYSTAQGTIYVDRWDLEYPTVPISSVVLRTDALEKTDAMYTVNNYLLRVGTYSKFKFNYQLLANQIKTKWVAVQYPADYYVKGGHNTGYMRDEQYAFFIRWIYNTGERSESYHIPGRAPLSGDTDNITSADAFEQTDGVKRKKWQVENTAKIKSISTYKLSDGGEVIASGVMGYWESTELYPVDRPDIWGTLCGKPIRHHKMPDATVGDLVNHFSNNGQNIVILGVQFENILHPLDNYGNPIESIVGYEILRGSREGTKSILGKGMFNNMRQYNIPGETEIEGLYQNYPYNDLRPDSYLTPLDQDGYNGPNTDGARSPKLTGYKKDVFSFHSPETTFSIPYLNATELKVYQQLVGSSKGSFVVPHLHPRFKLLTNGFDTALDVFATAISVMQTAATVAGGYIIDIASETGLPPIKLGIDKIIADGIGPLGSVSAGVALGATIANAAFQTAYTFLFGRKIAKQQLLGIVYALIPYRQFSAQYNSHGFYNQSVSLQPGNIRKKIIESNFISSSVQQFTANYQVNNQFRNQFVCVKIDGQLDDPSTQDDSRFTLGETSVTLGQITPRTISSYYGALKLTVPAQYGQLNSIKQLSISECIYPSVATVKTTTSTPVLFGGDTYIGRFTEKNSMYFFNPWLYEEPDGYEFNYCLYPTIPFPRYWVNSEKFIGLFKDKPTNHRVLDRAKAGNWFYMDSGYFYLFNSGVRDFFVESEINLAYRDYEDIIDKRHYDPYSFTDLTGMFRSDHIKSGNYYKYDYSLSVSKLFGSHITWGEILPKSYNPVVAETCYTYRPNRVVYSLPQQDESKKDGWRAFLVNNYKDFNTKVTSIKPINKTGAIFMMKFGSPLQFMGIEELKLDGTGAKITIGDGALFSGTQQLQAIVNADTNYEYGSCQNKYSAIGTKHGVFWVSQNQGKIYNYGGEGLNEISASGMKWWFAKYLPSQLLNTYPDYPLYDNLVKGIGVSTIYDNTNEILYIVKKDYKPLKTNYTYDEDGNFYLPGGVKIDFENERYFENASFTISYDCKSKTWISFHDWIPTFLLPGKNHFMSVNGSSVWKHNQVCDSYCNFYGVDYPWEVEFVSATGQTVNTVRSIEYILEAYKYSNDCRDKFHILDENFDRAMVYNSEQISGLLQLHLKTKNNPLDLLNYPKIGTDHIDIQYSKEENKYRFNQFWDVTKDRGEYNTLITNTMFITSPSGYKFNINPDYVNYVKPSLQHKKFRHNVNRVFLRKTQSDNVKYLFKISNQKLLQSPR